MGRCGSKGTHGTAGAALTNTTDALRSRDAIDSVPHRPNKSSPPHKTEVPMTRASGRTCSSFSFLSNDASAFRRASALNDRDSLNESSNAYPQQQHNTGVQGTQGHKLA